jgi:hypothetical protein
MCIVSPHRTTANRLISEDHVKNVKKLTVVGAGVLAAGATALTLIDTGVAGAAPDTSGQTFSEAQAALSKSGYQAVMGSSVGDDVSQGDCLVTRSQGTMAAPFIGGGNLGGGAPSGKPKVVLSLDCTKKAKQAASGSGSGGGG